MTLNRVTFSNLMDTVCKKQNTLLHHGNNPWRERSVINFQTPIHCIYSNARLSSLLKVGTSIREVLNSDMKCQTRSCQVGPHRDKLRPALPNCHVRYLLI